MLGTIKKYYKIYLTLLRLNFSVLTAYRGNFINATTASFVWGAFVIISMTLLTSKTSSVFGWTRNELLILSGTYNIIYSIFYFFFSENFEEFPFTIHFGRLDTILLKPLSSQFMISCWYIGYNSIIRFLVGVFFVGFMLFQTHTAITIPLVLQFVLLLLFSVSIIYSIWFLVISITIWLSRLSNLVDLLYSINGFTRYPAAMYKHMPNIMFIFIFPLTLVAVTPAKFLAQRLVPLDTTILIVISLLLLTAVHFFWKFALRFYTSVG